MTSEHNLSGRGKKSSIDLRRLKYFRAVCDHGGFSRAASVIGVAQPALTRQIKLLESEIGLPLIERNGRGAKPSEQGRFLLDRARGLLDGLDEVVRDLRQAFTAAGGAVTLGVCPTIAPFFVDDLTEHVARNHPNLSLSVIQAYSGDLRNLMAVGRLDMALTYSTPMSSESFTSRDLFSERLVLVSGYSRVRRRKRCRLAELASLKLILPSRIHTLRGIIDRACSMQAIVLKPDLELDRLDAVKASLLRKPSDRHTVLPYHSVRPEVDAGHLFCSEFVEPEMQRTIALVSLNQPRNVDAVARLSDRIGARTRELRQSLSTLL